MVVGIANFNSKTRNSIAISDAQGERALRSTNVMQIELLLSPFLSLRESLVEIKLCIKQLG